MKGIGIVIASVVLLGPAQPTAAQTTSGAKPTVAAAASAVTREALLAASREIIAAARYCTMITNGPAGQPSARIIDAFAPDADFTVWIGTLASSRKVSELRADPHVTLMYFNTANQEYVQLQGTGDIVTDSASRAAHWKNDWNAFYKDQWRGSDYALVRVRVRRVEVLSPKRGINNDPATWQPPSVVLP